MSDYGMFSFDGELEVNLLVTIAREKKWGWDRVQEELSKLAETPEYDEAMDTDVRNAVRRALGFTNTPMRY